MLFYAKQEQMSTYKKRTDNRLSLNRLQLPLGENRYGSIRSITYDSKKVKIQNSTKMTEMQRALQAAGRYKKRQGR